MNKLTPQDIEIINKEIELMRETRAIDQGLEQNKSYLITKIPDIPLESNIYLQLPKPNYIDGTRKHKKKYKK